MSRWAARVDVRQHGTERGKWQWGVLLLAMLCMLGAVHFGGIRVLSWLRPLLPLLQTTRFHESKLQFLEQELQDKTKVCARACVHARACENQLPAADDACMR